MYDGALVVVKLGGVQVSGLTDNSFSYAVDTFETTTKDSNGHKEYKAGEDGATISFSGLNDPTGTLSGHDLIALAAAKNAVAFVYGATANGSKILTGNAIITKVELTDPKNDAAGVSGELQVTGLITSATLSDAVAPLFESGAVNNASPTIMRLTFSEEFDANYKPASSVFTISPSKTISSYAIVGNKINITVSVAFGTSDTITIAYTNPGSGGLRDKSGNELATFTAEAVTNNVTA